MNLEIFLKLFMKKIYILRLFFISIFSFLSKDKYGGNKNGYDLCITTHGRRFIFIGIALDSFARDGKQFIRTVFLTVDSEEKLNWYKIFIIKKLKSKGCQIIRGNSSGPHSKYIHYLKNNWDGITSFYMIDDDVIYDPSLINDLFYESQKYKFCICARAYKIESLENKLKKYSSWKLLNKEMVGYNVCPTNVGGSVIKKDFSILLLDYFDMALKYAPTIDDIWFSLLAIEHQKPFKKIRTGHNNPVVIPFSQFKPLSNVNSTNNDIFIENLYTKKILQKINSDIKDYEN